MDNNTVRVFIYHYSKKLLENLKETFTNGNFFNGRQKLILYF